MNDKRSIADWSPLRFFFCLMATIAAVEMLVMLVLPFVLPEGTATAIEASVDAGLLTLGCAPILWWLTLRPLQKLARRERGIATCIGNTSSDPIVTLTANGRIVEFNDAAQRLFEYSAVEIEGESISKLLTTDEDTEESPSLVSVGRRVLTGVKRGGETFPVSISMGRVCSNQSELRLFTGIIYDLTEETRIQRELVAASQSAQAANRAKSEFLANMSHEIRTPMTAILGFTEVALEHAGDDVQPSLRTIRRNGEYLLRIIDDILDLSKIESGKLAIESAPLCPFAICTDVVAMLREKAQAKNVDLVLRFMAPLPETISTDATRLRQILINVINNAIKFTPQGSVSIDVDLVGERADSRLRIRVIDTGAGIAPQHLDRIFQPFEQADPSMTRRLGGTGLGLTISKKFAVCMGGDIQVESEPGVGSTFTITVSTGDLDESRLVQQVPSTCMPSRVNYEPKRKTGPETQTLHCRVLLAEDGPDNQRLIAHFLERAGADVTIARNGRIACDLVLAAREQGEPFDVILMDMQMPVLDGYQATAELRAAGWDRPIVALTAHAMSGDRQRCIDAGCDEYATKPINFRNLIFLVHHYANAGGVQTTAPRPTSAPDGAEATLTL